MNRLINGVTWREIKVKDFNILLVDDEINILNSYRRTLRNEFTFDIAQSGDEALSHIASGKKYAVVVTDMQMPNMNGLELLQKISRVSPDTIRIMLTGNSDQATAVNAVNIGDVFRFITKPCDTKMLITIIKAGIKQYNLVMAEKVLLNRTLKGVINVLTEVLALVNPDALKNSTKMIEYMRSLARALKVPDTWAFEPMIQLSQLGCVIFPQETIKSMENGDEISEEERQLFAQHPCLASDLIRQIPRMEKISETILYQEKCFNGAGVPLDNVCGKDIPLGARMLKIVIDFIRFEKREASKQAAFSRLESQQEFYDPQILSAFKSTLNISEDKQKPKSTDSENKEFIKLADLREEMIIETNIFTKREQLVASQGQRVTSTLLQILQHCIENNALDGKLAIQISEQTIQEKNCEEAIHD